MVDGVPGGCRRLAGRVALVTGGARGIGRAIVERLGAEGADVAFSFRRHGEEARALLRQLGEASIQAIACQADVAEAADCQALVDATIARFGRLDILVNNAAATDTNKPWTEIDETEWDRVMAVNVKGAFLCLRAAHRHLRQSPAGRIVNISSVTFHLGQPKLLHYVSSKGALIGFTRTLARELGAEGIAVNAVTPGAIRTEMELELFPDQQEEIGRRQAERQAMPRRGTAADIAAAVAFLVSDDASFITGQTINVDGGWAMP